MAIGGYLGICFCLAVIAVSKGANLDCDFKTNFCQWTNGSSVRHWKRHSFATLTPGTGPDIGHTTQEGVDYYIYLHAGEKKNKDGLVESGKCVLLSPAFNTTSGGSCFRFWYHMKGNGIGNLSAAVVEGSSSVSVWSKTGQQGADWKCAAFIIEQGKEDLQIAMTAWTGLNVIGDIALDDFKFVEKCNETTDLCSNITPKPSSTPPTQSSTPDEQSPISTTEGVVTTTPAEDGRNPLRATISSGQTTTTTTPLNQILMTMIICKTMCTLSWMNQGWTEMDASSQAVPTRAIHNNYPPLP